RPDGFHAGFFGRKPRREALKLIGLPLDVGDLCRRINPFDKTRPETRDRFANPRNLAQVDARTDDHFNSAPEVVVVRRPCFTPLVLISASATFRTSADLPRTTSTSRQWSWSRCTCSVERIAR